MDSSRIEQGAQDQILDPLLLFLPRCKPTESYLGTQASGGPWAIAAWLFRP